jgi:hypothetical protein
VPDNFRGAIAKDTLGSRVKRFNDARLVNGNDALDSGVENGPGSGIAFSQSRFRLLLFGDINAGTDDKFYGPAVIQEYGV